MPGHFRVRWRRQGALQNEGKQIEGDEFVGTAPSLKSLLARLPLPFLHNGSQLRVALEFQTDNKPAVLQFLAIDHLTAQGDLSHGRSNRHLLAWLPGLMGVHARATAADVRHISLFHSLRARTLCRRELHCDLEGESFFFSACKTVIPSHAVWAFAKQAGVSG